MNKNLEANYTIFFSALSIIGCILLILGCIIAPFFVSDYNWVTDTISDLAAGHSRFIMDFALYGFALGLFSFGLVAAHIHLGGKMWSISTFLIMLAGALVIIIGARNEYGDFDKDGVVLHMYFVYALGLCFLLIPLLMAQSLKNLNLKAGNALISLSLVWALVATTFLCIPTQIDGLLERLLGLLACAIICIPSILFITLAKDSQS